MVRRLLLVVVAAGAAAGTGCAGMSKTAQGAGVGAGVGAGAGAIIGAASGGKAGKGALIGGAAGALVGGLVGNEEDRKDREALERRVDHAEARAAAQNPPMTLEEIAELARDGTTSDEVIINQIRKSGATYDLSNEQVKYLRSYNVSNRVIEYMQNTRHGPPRRVIYQRPPPLYVVEPVPVFVRPPPPPGLYFHFRN